MFLLKRHDQHAGFWKPIVTQESIRGGLGKYNANVLLQEKRKETAERKKNSQEVTTSKMRQKNER